MKKLYTLCVGLLTLLYTENLNAQGGETFNNSNLTGTYDDGSFTGDEGFLWTYGHSRDEASFPIDGNGIMIRRASDSYIEATIPGGIGDFSFDYRKAFTGTSAREIELLINGNQVAVTPIFGTDSANDNVIYNLNETGINEAGNVVVKIKNIGTSTSNTQAIIDNISWTGYSGTAPTITANPTLLSGFIQYLGNPSPEQSFDVSGSNLNDSILLTVTNGDYEISETTGGTFSNQITLDETGGSVATTTIYVRLNGTATASPSNGDITITSDAAPDVVVDLEGEILDNTPNLVVSTNSLTGFSHFVGTPSAEDMFEVSGANLTDDVTLTAPTNFEISETSGSGFGTSITLTPDANDEVTATDIYVRLNGPAANYNQMGDIVVSSPGATDENVSLEGETFDYTLYPIGAVTTNDVDGNADSSDVFVELRGIVHCIDFNVDNGYNVTIIDEEEDGINVFNFDLVDGYTATEGDSIGVKGYINQFNGLTQIHAEEIELFSQGNATISPMIVTMLDESTESQLVTIEGLSLVDGETEWPSDGNIDVTDGTNTFTVRVTAASPLANSSTPAGTFEITGVGGQYDFNSPYDGGYQLFPCSVVEEDNCVIDVATSVDEITITANATGVDYQWVDCDDNYAYVPSATSQDFTPTENGNYAVILIENAICKDTSDCVEITTVGLGDNALNTQVKLYPNPFSEELNIESTDVSIETVEILNAAGQVIFSENIFNESMSVNTNSWETGIYIVKVKSKNNVLTYKIVK
ncbi:MAG: T9SS type A sorting domain-containing protein [Brumimicrobium sp.]